MTALNISLVLFLMAASFFCGALYSEFTNRNYDFPVFGLAVILTGFVAGIVHVTLRCVQ